MQSKNQIFRIIIYVALALGLRFLIAERILEGAEIWWLQVIAIAVIFGIGIGFIFRGTAWCIYRQNLADAKHGGDTQDVKWPYI